MKKLKQDNEILLHLLDELPVTEGASLRDELQLLYGTLIRQLEEAEASSSAYEVTAAKIRLKASLHKRRLVSRMKEPELEH